MDIKRFLSYLAKYEGLKLTAYQDSVGIWTIGIGSIKHPNGKPIKKGDKITTDQAYQYAEKEALHKLTALEKMLKVPQSEEQMMALLSLCYNIGEGGLRGSSVMKSINEGKDLATIEANWMKWNKGTINGVLKEIKGLTTRRKNEFLVYSGKIKP